MWETKGKGGGRGVGHGEGEGEIKAGSRENNGRYGTVVKGLGLQCKQVRSGSGVTGLRRTKN